jgi:metal-responsive CopG/Arc/MetJ family transcriptional regulator
METPKQKRKGREQLYGELKKPTMVALTPTGVEKLDELAAEFSLSRSEFVEQIARGILSVKGIESSPN